MPCQVGVHGTPWLQSTVVQLLKPPSRALHDGQLACPLSASDTACHACQRQAGYLAACCSPQHLTWFCCCVLAFLMVPHPLRMRTRYVHLYITYSQSCTCIHCGIKPTVHVPAFTVVSDQRAVLAFTVGLLAAVPLASEDKQAEVQAAKTAADMWKAIGKDSWVVVPIASTSRPGQFCCIIYCLLK